MKPKLKGLEETFWVLEYKETGKFISKLCQTRILPNVEETTENVCEALRMNEADSGALCEYLSQKGYLIKMYKIAATLKVL